MPAPKRNSDGYKIRSGRLKKSRTIARIKSISQTGYATDTKSCDCVTFDSTCTMNTLSMKKNQLTPNIQSVVINASRAIPLRNFNVVGIRNRPQKTRGYMSMNPISAYDGTTTWWVRSI